MAAIRIAALPRLDGSFASSLRLHAALGISTLAHAAMLFNGAAPLGAWPSASTVSRELSVSLAPPASPSSPAAPAAHTLVTRRAPTPAEPLLRRPRPPEATPAVAEDGAGDGVRAPASAAANQLASAAPAAGLLDLFDAPRARFAPAPDYPDEARWEGREGRVLLRFRLRADGRVGEADIVSSSGHADLDAAALATLRRWSFGAPNGVAPEAWYRHAFRFALQ